MTLGDSEKSLFVMC